jgi:hypothetical protein
MTKQTHPALREAFDLAVGQKSLIFLFITCIAEVDFQQRPGR